MIPLGLGFVEDQLTDFSCRINAISLGQGQGPVAEKMITAATANGDWVFLQVWLQTLML